MNGSEFREGIHPLLFPYPGCTAFEINAPLESFLDILVFGILASFFSLFPTGPRDSIPSVLFRGSVLPIFLQCIYHNCVFRKYRALKLAYSATGTQFFIDSRNALPASPGCRDR